MLDSEVDGTDRMDAAPPGLAGKPRRKRRVQERAERTRAKLLDAAELAFSQHGFDAVAVREVENMAGVRRNLVRYHFGNKEALWKAMVGRLIAFLGPEFTSEPQSAPNLGEGGALRERLALVIRRYVKFSAAHPAFHRLMVQEGKVDIWRIGCLVDAYLRPAMLWLRRIVEDELRLSDEEFFHWYYLFVGAGPMPFTMAPEAREMFGVDVRQEEIIERHAQIMVDFLLSRTTLNSGISQEPIRKSHWSKPCPSNSPM